MKIIYKYILKEILKTFIVILMGITFFILISMFLDEIPMLVKYKPPFSLLFNYFLFKIPFLMAEATPFAMLFTVLFVFSQLNKFNELTAMKTLGIDFFKIISPVLLLSLLISLLSFIINETIVSSTYEKSKYIKEHLIEKKSSTNEIKYNLAKLGYEGRVFYIDYFDGLLGMMKGICIIKIDKKFNIIERIDAKEAKWQNNAWILKDGIIRYFEGSDVKDIKKFSSFILQSNDTPKSFIVKKRSPEDTLTINIFRLRKLIKVLKESGFNYREEAVNFHIKFAFPLSTFILTLLGVSIPFMFFTQRSVLNAALGFIFTVITSFFYMGFLTIGLSTGKTGVLSPFLSAWISNFIFLGLGILFLSKVKK